MLFSSSATSWRFNHVLQGCRRDLRDRQREPLGYSAQNFPAAANGGFSEPAASLPPTKRAGEKKHYAGTRTVSSLPDAFSTGFSKVTNKILSAERRLSGTAGSPWGQTWCCERIRWSQPLLDALGGGKRAPSGSVSPVVPKHFSPGVHLLSGPSLDEA